MHVVQILQLFSPQALFEKLNLIKESNCNLFLIPVFKDVLGIRNGSKCQALKHTATALKQLVVKVNTTSRL